MSHPGGGPHVSGPHATTTDRERIADALRAGVAALAAVHGISLPAGAEARLLDYLELLAKWNRTYNLTAIRELDRMVTQHLLDSLAVLPALDLHRAASLLDIGSGAGLPGIPLAIARPDAHFTLIDSNSKKTAFLQQARIELDLANLEVVCARIEDYRPAEAFDLIVSRAFAELSEFVRVASPLLAPGAVMAAMKGVIPHEELANLPPGWEVTVIPVNVPGLTADRCLVRLRQPQPQ